VAGEPSGQRPRPVGLGDQRRAERRLWVAAAWIGGSVALFAVLLRISLSWPMDSDGANNALQAWDMLHGHLLLPGWIIGDASVYTFERVHSRGWRRVPALGGGVEVSRRPGVPA
jgi:hypothetical protein